ncbi:hypothetical protein R3I94_008754 [Phoxinus phoxinus]
MCKRLQDIF